MQSIALTSFLTDTVLEWLYYTLGSGTYERITKKDCCRNEGKE